MNLEILNLLEDPKCVDCSFGPSNLLETYYSIVPGRLAWEDGHILISDELRLELICNEEIDLRVRLLVEGDSMGGWIKFEETVALSLLEQARFNSIFLNSHQKSQNGWLYRRKIIEQLLRVPDKTTADKEATASTAAFEPTMIFDIADTSYGINNTALALVFGSPEERLFLASQFRMKDHHYLAAQYLQWLVFEQLPWALEHLETEDKNRVLITLGWLDYLEQLAFAHPSYDRLTRLLLDVHGDLVEEKLSRFCSAESVEILLASCDKSVGAVKKGFELLAPDAFLNLLSSGEG